VDYKESGVDIDAGTQVVRRVQELARETFTRGVLSEIGSFGGLFQPDLADVGEPVLVSSADGVGTKLKIAFLTGRHRTVGRDLVNHCVNDILVQNARPLFFLDYLGTGKLSPTASAEVIQGVADGCRENGCALLGGETAEMPGFYADGEYDVVGFIVGIVDRSRLLDGQSIRPGDRLLGLSSAGLHTNGYSLARRVLFDAMGLTVDSPFEEVSPAATVGDVLLAPHRSYLGVVGPLLDAGHVRGLAHITGGGLTDNVPRVLPAGTGVRIDRASWTVPPLFEILRREGQIPDEDMYRTFNMGLGMVVVCRESDVDRVRRLLVEAGEPEAPVIGEVVEGNGHVSYVG
jgi:phosphoribosylformylglycinamidine cyclo-ligase